MVHYIIVFVQLCGVLVFHDIACYLQIQYPLENKIYLQTKEVAKL